MTRSVILKSTLREIQRLMSIISTPMGAMMVFFPLIRRS